MKTRLKTKAEHIYDKSQLERAEKDFMRGSQNFFGEYVDCEGDVWHSTYQKTLTLYEDLCHEQRIEKHLRVGDSWDWDKGITGHYRYP